MRVVHCFQPASDMDAQPRPRRKWARPVAFEKGRMRGFPVCRRESDLELGNASRRDRYPQTPANPRSIGAFVANADEVNSFAYGSPLAAKWAVRPECERRDRYRRPGPKSWGAQSLEPGPRRGLALTWPPWSTRWPGDHLCRHDRGNCADRALAGIALPAIARGNRRRESVLSNQHRLLGEDTRHRALR
jgi:hypothetical protein